MANQGNGWPFDPALRKIFEELRELRLEARADRVDAAADRRQAAADRQRSDERFAQLLREMRQESRQDRRELRHDIRTVGLAIVKTLNRHTRLLEGIDRKLGVRGNGGTGNGRRA